MRQSAVQTSMQTRVGLALLTVALCHFIVDFMLGIWPVYKTMIQLNLAKAGLLTAACTMVGEATQLWFGPLSDRGYRRLLMVLGVGLTAAAACLAYTTNYWVLALLLTLIYVGSGAFHPAGGSLAFTLAPERRGLMMGVFAAGGALGLALSQVVYSAFFDWFSGQTLLLCLPVLAIALFALFQPLPEEAAAIRPRVTLRSFWELLKQRNLRRLYICQCFNQAFYWGWIFLLPDVLFERGYEEWIYKGGGHLVMVMGLAILTIPLGHLADRVGTRNVMACLIVTIIGSLYFILTQPLLHPTLLLGVLFVMGAALGSLSPMGVVLGHRLHTGSPGLITSFLMGCVWLVAEGIGPGIGGLLTTLFYEEAAAKAVAILGVGLLIAFGLILALPNHKTRETKS